MKSLIPLSMVGRLALACLALAPLTTNAETIFGLTESNRLFSFDSATPTVINPINGGNPINGLPPNEHLLAIDFRPVATDSPAAAFNGVLYAWGDTRHLYTINTVTGTATLIPGPPLAISGFAVGMDFNAVPDRLRIVHESDENIRLNPNDATITAVDTPLAYIAGDPNVGVNPNVVGAAYTNNFGGATQTTLYGIDFALNALVRQGGVNGIPSPNTGQLSTIGPLGFDTTDELGFDISGQSGIAYASLTPVVGPLDISSELFTINLATGAATLIGPIGPAGGPGAFITLDIAAPVGTPIPEPTALGLFFVGVVIVTAAPLASFRSAAARTRASPVDESMAITYTLAQKVGAPAKAWLCASA
jgi:hypothetical protein